MEKQRLCVDDKFAMIEGKESLYNDEKKCGNIKNIKKERSRSEYYG